MTYRIELFTRTAKGKTNHIDDIFVSTEATKEDVQKYYAEKYKPVSVAVSEVEVVDIKSKEPEEIGVSKREGSIYSDPEYRIHRDTLPKEVKELLNHLDEIDKDTRNTKSKITQLMQPYFTSGCSMSSHSSDAVTFRGYMRPFALNIRKPENE